MQSTNNPSSRNRGRSANSHPAPGTSSAGRQDGFSSDVSDDDIARRAYARWEGSDRSPGRDQEHWFAAEQELRGGRRQAGQDSTADNSGRNESDNGL
jgi:hypothetical protein